jgi:hypothetical protein
MTRPDTMTYDSRNSPAENLATGRCLAVWRSHSLRARPIYRPCGKNSAVIAPDKSAVRDKASQDQNGSSCALTNRVGVAISQRPARTCARKSRTNASTQRKELHRGTHAE